MLAVALAATLLSMPAHRAAAQAPAAIVPPWWDARFEANERACGAADRPAWCAQWIEALNADLRAFGDRSVPEWRALPYDRNREICSTLLPPPWCTDWRAYIRAVPESDAYKAVAARHEATSKAENEVAERTRREREAYEAPLNAVLTKVTAGRSPTRDEVALLESRALEDGNQQAAEALAWLYVQGRGVGRDYGRAYELYGDLVVKGREDLKKNLDALWPLLTGSQKQAMQQRFGSATQP
jgi:TPR repeat protein